jgi:hypothetical protein
MTKTKIQSEFARLTLCAGALLVLLGLLSCQIEKGATAKSIPSVLDKDYQSRWTPVFLTNEPALSNGRAVLAAVLCGDAKSRSKVQALIGSQVVFVGGAAPPGGNANLLVWSNVVLEVEIRPLRDVRPRSVVWSVEVLGTLKSVDLAKRTIHIRAKPEDWIVRDTF